MNSDNYIFINKISQVIHNVTLSLSQVNEKFEVQEEATAYYLYIMKHWVYLNCLLVYLPPIVQ